MLLALFRMDFFEVAHGWVESKKALLLEICYTYPTMIKLGTVISYLKEIPKLYKSGDTLLEFG